MIREKKNNKQKTGRSSRKQKQGAGCKFKYISDYIIHKEYLQISKKGETLQ